MLQQVYQKMLACRTFFKSGKGLSVRRGAGQDQPILRVMARRLASHGDWVCSAAHQHSVQSMYFETHKLQLPACR